jgi:hypothetical protein
MSGMNWSRPVNRRHASSHRAETGLAEYERWEKWRDREREVAVPRPPGKRAKPGRSLSKEEIAAWVAKNPDALKG